MRKHADLALKMGMDSDNIYIGDIGDVIELSKNEMKKLEPVHAGKVFVDGLGVGDVGSVVLRDRKHLGEDGLIIVMAAVDFEAGTTVSGPDIVSRGFVYMKESEDLLDAIRKRASWVLEYCRLEDHMDRNFIKQKVKDEISRLIYEKTRRSPMILPILMEL